jgi:hypothetical protein
MQSKCLKSISLIDCGIDGSLFITQFLQFDIGLREFNLSGSDLSRPLTQIGKVAVQELTFLGLARCKTVSFAFLQSLLDLFESRALGVSALDLSDLQLSNSDDFSSFLARLAGVKIPGLKSLVFDNAHLNSAQAATFTQFVEQQTQLASLSVNCSIDVSGSPLGLANLISGLSNTHLRHLSIRSDGSMRFSFGQLLAPLLSLEIMNRIEYLDLTNQAIGEKGLETVALLLEAGSLSQLYCDGSTESFEVLVKFCERVLATNAQYVAFPAGDFDKAFRLLAADQNDAAMNARREDLSRRFAEKFADAQESSDRMKEIFFANVPSPAQEIARKLPARERHMVKSESDNLIPKGLEGATKMGPEVDALYHECVVDGDSMDPVFALMATIHDRLSLEALIEAARQG